MKYAVSLLIGILFFNFQPIEADVNDGIFPQEGELNTCLLDILPEPSSIIGGAVNIITGLLCIILFLYLLLGGCDKRTEDEKIAHQVMYKVVKILERRYQLHYIGRAEAGLKDYYTKMGLEFQVFRLVGKDEGRKMLIDCIGEFLKEINSNSKLLPHLQPSPFTVANIQISIYVYHPNGTSVKDPEIAVFSTRDGIIQFGTDTQKEGYEYGYIVYQKESYEEALKIVEAQNKSP